MIEVPVKADPAVVRRHNASIVLHHLRLHAPLSRADLAKRIGLNRSTVSSIVSQLLDEGLVYETSKQPAKKQTANQTWKQSGTQTEAQNGRRTGRPTDKVGRPGLSLELNPRGGCAIGVEIDTSGVHVIVTDFVANVLWRRRVRLGPEESQESYLHCAEELIRRAMGEAALHHGNIWGIGVAAPALVDVAEGVITYAPSLHWHNLALRSRWETQFGLPVMVENNANAAALGEFYFGVATEVTNFLYLGAGATMGGGIIVDGRLFRGRGGFAGEMGHMTLNPEGPECLCGRRGCWETLAGPRAVVNHYLRRAALAALPSAEDQGDHGFHQVVRAADDGDLAALVVMQEMGHYLGVGIANLVNIFNPQLIVLGGVYNQANETIIPIIKQTVTRHSLFPMRTALSVIPSRRGADDGILGAAALILDGRMRSPV